MSSSNSQTILQMILEMDLKGLSRYSGVPYPPIQYRHRQKLALLFQTSLILAQREDAYKQTMKRLDLESLS
jgi:hypothetical protein